MNSRSFCNPLLQRQAIDMRIRTVLRLAGSLLACCLSSWAGDAPQWMHAAATAPLPEHDDKTAAVLIYSETNVSVQALDKVRTHVRIAYKILRPTGKGYGVAVVSFDSHKKITSLHGWCIPAQGKDYEVKDKEALEVSLLKVAGSELISDVKDKMLQIPAPDPGNVVGYEYDEEEQPMVLQKVWYFQHEIPARELRYSLQIPAGWEFKASWINHPEVQPVKNGNNQFDWTINEIPAIRREPEMPPIQAVAGQLVISFFPPGSPWNRGFSSWQEMGNWYVRLTTGRRDSSPQITQQVTTLTASAHTPLEKMKVLADFVQHDIRYVAIELGIGGYQPHSAADVFNHHYGDCKDKATLLSSMLSQIGVESFYVLINSERGSVSPDTPASVGGFDHVVLAIKLPAGTSDPSLLASIQHPRLGTLLYFDPTNELTPFGEIGGYLQANYGLLVTPEGGELVELPALSPSRNSIRRSAILALDSAGTLKGYVTEIRTGDRARMERGFLRSVTRNAEKVKPIEDILAGSLSRFYITKATIDNAAQSDLPFGLNYTFEAPEYAKNTGGMLLVRPRVLGVKASGLLETKEVRKFPIEFDGPVSDADSFEITIPPGFVVDDVPPPTDADYEFASYHSKTEVQGNVIRYSRSFEVKQLSVPVSRADELKKFYRLIASDERNTVILKAATP